MGDFIRKSLEMVAIARKVHVQPLLCFSEASRLGQQEERSHHAHKAGRGSCRAFANKTSSPTQSRKAI